MKPANLARALTVCLCLTALAGSACDSKSKETTEADDDGDSDKKSKKKKKKDKKKDEEKDEEADDKPIEVKGIPDFVVPAGGDHFTKAMGDKQMDAYAYKSLSKYPLAKVKADFRRHLEAKGWTVEDDFAMKAKKGSTTVEVIIIQNVEQDAVVLNIMSVTTA